MTLFWYLCKPSKYDYNQCDIDSEASKGVKSKSHYINHFKKLISFILGYIEVMQGPYTSHI